MDVRNLPLRATCLASLTLVMLALELVSEILLLASVSMTNLVMTTTDALLMFATLLPINVKTLLSIVTAFSPMENAQQMELSLLMLPSKELDGQSTIFEQADKPLVMSLQILMPMACQRNSIPADSQSTELAMN
jgi:hypothetical protein